MVYNHITVTFGALRKVTALPINYIDDVKQVLVIRGLTLPEYYVVDFCNEGDSSVIPITATSDGAEIPDTLLTTGKAIKAYIVVSGNEGDVQTRYEVKIPVNNRPHRNDVDPTDEQQQQIDALVAALNDGVGRAEAAADDAEQAAELLTNPSAEATTLEPDEDATASYADGVFSFGIPKGAQGIPGEPGTPGKDGKDGVDGVTPDFSIGTVSTLPAGSDATATITGTTANPVLNLGLPQGAKGDPGEVTQDDLDAAIAPLNQQINELTTEEFGKNIYDYTKNLHNKYLNPNGVIEDLANRIVTDYMPVVPGKYVTISYIAASTNKVTQTGYAAICCFDSEKNVVSGGNYNKTTFLVPNGVAFVRVTKDVTIDGPKAMIELTDDGLPTTFAFYCGNSISISDDIIIPETPLGYMRSTGNLSDGQSLVLPYHNVKNQNVLVFSGKISIFDKLKIGKQTDTYITIDSTNVTITNDQTSSVLPHGLTISNDIQVIICNEDAITPSQIKVTSCGVSFTAASGSVRFLMDEGSPYATSIGSTLTDCVFSWTSRNINKPIWVFGDSYISWYPQRWSYYLSQDGFTKSCMLNGYAGESSVNAMTALQSLLAVKVPQYIVWCMGMNNADSTEVNPTWYYIYTALLEYAKVYGFKLILATIPNTPTVNNSYKNAIVRNSGYRYIDFDGAVDIDGVGTWIPGTLSEDNTHPTENGARVLYYQVLVDFPEITTL